MDTPNFLHIYDYYRDDKNLIWSNYNVETG